MTLNGKVAVVTGGASGIGAACCRELAKQGATVVVLDLAEGNAAAVAAEFRGTAKNIDVGDAEQISSVALEIEHEFGAVDILVNSAGIIQLPRLRISFRSSSGMTSCGSTSAAPTSVA
jgi:NAD(P)-dependent dehydrogenase (short-subunit alcohol dehydrogenase family)